MRIHAPLLFLAASLGFNCAQPAAATKLPPSGGATRSAQLAREISLPTPAVLIKSDSSAARHLFPVMDEKGLLLTCVAPEIDTDSETDVFKNCALAPGRTLDDVMHSFIRGIHEEQRQRNLENSQAHKDPVDHAEQKSAQK